jgi:hypothetical protein
MFRHFLFLTKNRKGRRLNKVSAYLQVAVIELCYRNIPSLLGISIEK